MSEFYTPEGDIGKRIEDAKKYAATVFYGQGTKLDDDLLRLHFQLSQHYMIPLYSPYFKERTLDELVFEWELINLSKKPAGDTMKEIMASEDDKKELESLFDDWDTNNSVDLSENIEYDEDEMVKKFMETGEFINS